MSEGKVVKFYPNDSAKNPDAVLEQAIGQLDNVIVIGDGKGDSGLEARASTNIKKKDILWMIEQFKLTMLMQLEDEEE